MRDGRDENKEKTLLNLSSGYLSKIRLSEKIYFWDETLRDGEQSPGVVFTVNEKIELAKLLDEVGMDIIDVGYAAISESERKAIKAVAKENLKAEICTTARACKKDIDYAASCEEVKRLGIFAPTSPIMMGYTSKLEKNENAKQDVVKHIEYGKKYGLSIDFVSVDTSRSDPSFVAELFDDALESGADVLMITDTVGIANPESMKYIVNSIKNRMQKKDAKLGVHCHNDFGLATANTLSAIEAGVNYTTTTINGIGERAGNAAFEEVVMALEIIYGKKTRIKTEKIFELSEAVQKCSGVYKQPNKAIVGFNAFRHESGIHVDAQMKNPSAFEPIPPEKVGRKRKYVLGGKHIGKSLIKKKLEEEGIEATDKQINMIRDNIKLKKETTPKDKIPRMIARLKEYNHAVFGFPETEFWSIVYSVTYDGDKHPAS